MPLFFHELVHAGVDFPDEPVSLATPTYPPVCTPSVSLTLAKRDVNEPAS